MITLRRLDLVRQESPATADELASLQMQVNAQLQGPAATVPGVDYQPQLDALQAEIDALELQVAAMTPVSGTWTPVIGGDGGTSGQTYTAQVGHYTKIGKRVWIECSVVLSNKGTITGVVEIAGLPFAAGTMVNPPVAIAYWGGTATAFVHLAGYIWANRPTAVRVLTAPLGAVTNFGGMTTADLTNTSSFAFGCSYQTA